MQPRAIIILVIALIAGFGAAFLAKQMVAKDIKKKVSQRITYEKDSTDPRNGISGLRLYVDNQTGCHYLSGIGGIIKRTDAVGDHICTGQER